MTNMESKVYKMEVLQAEPVDLEIFSVCLVAEEVKETLALKKPNLSLLK